MREMVFRTSSANSGFTLIELLVVVAIIGILSSIVLVSLSTANTRGKDGAVQANLNSLRTQAQLYYNANGGYSLNGASIPASSSCTAANSVFVDPRVTLQIDAANLANGGGSVTCNVAAGGAGYAVYAQLPSYSTATYFCVDSNGVGMRTTTVPGNNTSCL